MELIEAIPWAAASDGLATALMGDTRDWPGGTVCARGSASIMGGTHANPQPSPADTVCPEPHGTLEPE